MYVYPYCHKDRIDVSHSLWYIITRVTRLVIKVTIMNPVCYIPQPFRYLAVLLAGEDYRDVCSYVVMGVKVVRLQTS